VAAVGELAEGRTFPSSPPVDAPVVDKTREISRVAAEGLDWDQVMAACRPVIVSGLTSEWQALHKWSDLEFWAREHGTRLVPIELGRTETPASTGDVTLPISDFVERSLAPSTTDPVPLGPAHQALLPATAATLKQRVGYLAQHPLLDHLPALHSDVDPAVPGFGTEPLSRNVWIGTSGTITALHYDKDDNTTAVFI